jgi:nucleotide-binding universal stress UspA family protein
MKILLAVDSSQASQAATTELSLRPWPEGSSAMVLHVVEPLVPWAPEELQGHSEEVVRQAAEQLQARGLSATPLVRTGNPKGVIVEQAREMHADLVMVGPHGIGDLAHFLLGGTASGVLRFAPCSVEISRGASRWSQEGRGIRVLLATDGSEHANLAAKSIAHRPWPAGTEIRVLSVVELPVTIFQAAIEPPFLATETMETLRANSMKRAQGAILEARQILNDAGLETSESISVLFESPKKVVLDEARQWPADLLVVGSHGRHGFDRFLMGSVSEAVALHADCSVEVIRNCAE